MTKHPSSIIHHPFPWLHRYALLFAAATFILVALGGNVTSRGAGLSVPDGFTVYGYFLWAFPVDRWVGNVWHEHVHRLKGSIVGLMAIGLCVWMLARYGRTFRGWLGVALLALVIVQGVMGGLRVELVNWFGPLATPTAVAHAVLGQLFFVLTVVAVVVTGKWWAQRVEGPIDGGVEAHALNAWASGRAWCFVLLGALVLQLTLGAAMRHTGSGLAIPDFPASYGRVVPPLSQQGIIAASDAMVPYDQAGAVGGYFTPLQVGLAFAHRLWALGVLVAAAVALRKLTPAARVDAILRAPMLILIVLLAAQVVLGALTVWTGRVPDVATAHQATGALTLASAGWLTLRAHLARVPAMPVAVDDKLPAWGPLPAAKGVPA